MESKNAFTEDRLEKIISIRMNDKDLDVLIRIMKNRRTNLSKIVRAMISNTIRTIEENNWKE